MHLDLSWIFSIFKVPKISSDARSFRPRRRNCFRYLWRPCFYDRNRCDATFSIPEELASTSASIVKAGLNNIWRKYKVPRPSEPQAGSQVPFVPLQKYNEKPPLKASQNGCIPAGQYPFKYIHPHSHHSHSIFFPTISPSQADSLLFLTPTPPLPPAPASEPNPDHEFSTQSTTPSLSPLPIALSLEFPPLAAPPPPELVIKIAGYLNTDHKSHIRHFLSRATEVQLANSLVVIWQLSHIDDGGKRGLTSLKALFALLDEKVHDSDGTALSRFSNLSITIPDQVKDVAPSRYNNDLLQPVKEDDSIDFANAINLHGFTWHGDFFIFTKLKNLQFVTLNRLNIKSPSISINDAITLLHSCPGLQTLSLGTIRSDDAILYAGESLKSSGGVERRKALPSKLTYLALESDVALHPLIRRFCWTAQVSLSLTLRKQGTASLDQALDSASQ